MNNISTGEFFRKTYQTYGISECVIGSIDCSYNWKLLGTLNGICLEYDPNEGRIEKQFNKDSQLRISVKINDSDCTTGILKFCKISISKAGPERPKYIIITGNDKWKSFILCFFWHGKKSVSRNHGKNVLRNLSIKFQ